MEAGISKTKEIIIGVVLIAIFGTLMYFGLNLFKNETDMEPAVNLDKEVKAEDHIKVKLHVTAIDPIKGDMVVRVNCDPEGAYAEDKLTLAKDIVVYTNSNSGKNEHSFKKGSRINPFEVTVDMHDGSVMEYPFDDHLADLSIDFVAPQKDDSTGKVENIDVPVVKETIFYASMNGYKITEIKESEAADGYSDISFTIERIASIRMFSIFVMCLMWFITIAIILVVGSIIVRKRKVEYGMFAFLSAMIFALPALRNIQPFVPTLGAYSDFIAFFWAELTVAVGLVILIITWLKRPSAKHGM